MVVKHKLASDVDEKQAPATERSGLSRSDAAAAGQGAVAGTRQSQQLTTARHCFFPNDAKRRNAEQHNLQYVIPNWIHARFSIFRSGDVSQGIIQGQTTRPQNQNHEIKAAPKNH